MKRRIAFIVLISVMAVATAARFAPRLLRANADSLPDLIELAPHDASSIAYADLAGLRDSPLVERLATMSPPVTADPDYAAFVKATGFDYQKDLDRAVFATTPAGNIALAEGRFDRPKIEQYILRSGKLEQQNGHAVYRLPAAKTPGKMISIAFLDARRIVISDGGDLSAELSGSATLDADLRERLLRVAGSPVFAVAKTPATAAPAAGAPGQGMSAMFQSLRWVSFAARPDGDQIYVSVEGECDNPAQAQTVAGGAQLVRGLLQGVLTDPKARGNLPPDKAAALGKLLDSVNVTTEGPRARLLVTVTPDILQLMTTAPPAPVTH